jgi:D-alanyl-D-alanine carboxypeptidase/D-alanyl-D-alanine-endopeptidase (penicillin-binding protein 4)
MSAVYPVANKSRTSRHFGFGPTRDIGGGYADTSSHGLVCFVISLNSNEGAMRFRLLKAIEAGL